MNPQEALHFLDTFPKLRIGVIGDVMLDRFIWGDAERISPEAPIPVVLVKNETAVPGGAANTAANIAALGSDVQLIGLIGHDEPGGVLCRELDQRHVNRDLLLVATDRPTTQKSRVVAKNQQLVRFDHEVSQPIGPEIETQILRSIEEQLEAWQAIILSDYCKGVITPSLAKAVIQLANSRRVPVIVDTKNSVIDQFTHCSVITPNHREASAIARVDDVAEAGRRIQQKLGGGVLITQGSDGMTLFTSTLRQHFPTQAQEVFDVAGAGDTVVAALSLALAAGAPIETAAVIANHAAGIVVGKLGTAIVTPMELRQSFSQHAD